MTASTNRVAVDATPDAVFDVLDDPCAYPRWVVGTRRIRRVEDDWPQPGARFHHGIGLPGAELRDWSRVQTRDRPRRLVLDVRFRPAGTARVEITVRPQHSGSVVELVETPTHGLAAQLPAAVVTPMLSLRNSWSLRRLQHLVEHPTTPDAPERPVVHGP